MMRQHVFDITTFYTTLKDSLPLKTQIYHTWPSHDKKLPSHVVLAATNSQVSGVLMSEPIHVIEGETLEVTLLNNLDSTGLSLHWHGFEMIDLLHFDGVVGLTQCALSPGEKMVYNFTVNEVPGTYWYHTHSGSLGVNAKNEIKAPLIVHPNTNESIALLDAMYANSLSSIEDSKLSSYDHLTSYGQERLLFLSDGFLISESSKQWVKMGGLNPPVSKNDDGYTVGSYPYQYGTCNGKLREVVQVVPGESYKLRLLNGGSLYAFRISIDGIPMKIVAADSEPVNPYVVDEVILHAAERFDVMVTIPPDTPTNTSMWIRADTLESVNQGYQNGVRAIMHVVEEVNTRMNYNQVADPKEDIVSSDKPVAERLTMNCYSRYERETRQNGGDCLLITDLVALKDNHEGRFMESSSSSLSPAAHTIDFQFTAPPYFSHFTRIDEGDWYQHVNPVKSHFFDTNLKLHENTAMLHLPSYSTVLLVWRNKSLMDHPIHLHGYKMEILDIYIPKQEEACSRADCELPTVYESEVKLQNISSKPFGSGVMKDTFIMPAGGAVVTRIKTLEPAVWFAHCHLESHREDGMALIVNVGNFTATNTNTSWLPNDFPPCDHPFIKSLHDEPACTCYQNKDAILDQELTPEHKCSRDHLCLHSLSEVANLKSYKSSGISMRSDYALPNYAITLLVTSVVALFSFALWWYAVFYRKKSAARRRLEFEKENNTERIDRKSLKRRMKRASTVKHLVSNDAYRQHFQLMGFREKLKAMGLSQFKGYRRGCVNLLRVVEVVLLGALVGSLFYDVGNNSSGTSLGQKTGFLFFSVTLWTFTRMYPSVGSTNVWYKLARDFSKSLPNSRKISYLSVLWLTRTMVVFLCESWWPILHVFVAYPLAGMFGRIDACLGIAFFLVMNNLCYISLGGLLGVLSRNVSTGMIVSTVVSQTSLLAAGFYTTLPPGVKIIRMISPVYWTYSGILKTAMRTTDTFKCYKGGQSDVGVNQCYIEQSVGIDLMKRRGINVATFNDPSSTSIWLEAVVLVTLYVVLNLFILGVLLITSWRQKPGDKPLFSQETLDAAKGLAKMRTSQNSGNAARLSHVASSDEFAGDLHMDLAFLEEVAATENDDDDDDNNNNKNKSGMKNKNKSGMKKYARIDMTGGIINEEEGEESDTSDDKIEK